MSNCRWKRKLDLDFRFQTRRGNVRAFCFCQVRRVALILSMPSAGQRTVLVPTGDITAQHEMVRLFEDCVGYVRDFGAGG